MAGPICPVAGEKDQVTGKGLIFLHHDNVPNLQDTERVVTERPPCVTAHSGLELTLLLYPEVLRHHHGALGDNNMTLGKTHAQAFCQVKAFLGPVGH